MELIAPSRQLDVKSLKGSMRVNPPPAFFLREEFSRTYEEELEAASPEVVAMTHAVSLHLEEALRTAKTTYLGAGEVLFPTNLLPSIARDILRMAESEPLGLRGCLIHLNFESASQDLNQTHSASVASLTRSLSSSSLSSTSSDDSNPPSKAGKAPPPRSIGSIKWDPHSVPTFELSLTFKQEWTPWYNRLPNILRLNKKPSVILSGKYVLSKKKLYRSGRS